MHHLLGQFAVSIFVLLACNDSTMQITLLQRQVLAGVPSASGMAQIDGQIYVVGDNSPWLFRLGEDYQVADRTLLFSEFNMEIIPKKIKPDLESITELISDSKRELLIFGSGSKTPHRDVLLLLDLDNPGNVRTHSLAAFYQSVKTSSSLSDSSLNIEGSAIVGDDLFLFNREGNLVLHFSLAAFLESLESGVEYPAPKVYPLTLPSLDGFPAQISGASPVAGTEQIVFTASVENRSNTIDDGEIYGSYVGILSLDQLAQGHQPPCRLLEDGGTGLPLKVESLVTLPTSKPGVIDLLLVTDSDGAESEVLRATVHW